MNSTKGQNQNLTTEDPASLSNRLMEAMVIELRAIRETLDAEKKQAPSIQLPNASFERSSLVAIINSNLIVAIFGGALTLPILGSNISPLGSRLVTGSFLLFGTNTISCLFWLLRISLPDSSDLTDDLSPFEKIMLVLVGTIGHTLFNFAGLMLLAATATTYSFQTGLVCVAVMGTTALIYFIAGSVYLTRHMHWGRVLRSKHY